MPLDDDGVDRIVTGLGIVCGNGVVEEGLRERHRVVLARVGSRVE